MKSLSIGFALFVAGSLSSVWAFRQEGMASWYGGKFIGRQTANGEIFDTDKMTAAHLTLPFGSIATVTNVQTGKQVQVRINDRGPFAKGRVVDLSRAAADQLGLLKEGTGLVRIEAEAVPIDTAELSVIQVGAYKNPYNALKVKEKLQAAGLNPYASMTTNGIIRIELRNVPKVEHDNVINKLQEMGILTPLVKKPR